MAPSAIFISEKLHNKILRAYLYDCYEKGGLLFLKDNTVMDFAVDDHGGRDTYYPSLPFLYEASAKPRSYCDSFSFIHSHPTGWLLSKGDLYWTRDFMRLNGFAEVLLFLCEGWTLHAYSVTMISCVEVGIQLIQ